MMSYLKELSILTYTCTYLIVPRDLESGVHARWLSARALFNASDVLNSGPREGIQGIYILHKA